MVINFCDFTLLNPDSILDPILKPPGLRFGRFLASKMAETCLGIRLGPSKSRSRLLFFDSKKHKKRVPKKVTKKGPGQGGEAGLGGSGRVSAGQRGPTMVRPSGMCGPGLSSFELTQA